MILNSKIILKYNKKNYFFLNKKKLFIFHRIIKNLIYPKSKIRKKCI